MSSTDQEMCIGKCDKTESEEDNLSAIVLRLKEWLNNQEHLPNITNEKLLYHIAAATKGNCMRACKRLDTYYTIRTLIPEFFALRDPSDEEIKRSFKCLTANFLPNITSPDGCRIFVITLLDQDPNAFEIISYLRRVYMVFDLYYINGELNPRQGVYFLIDAKGASVGHVMKISPAVLRKAVFCAQDVYPIKVKGLIFINVNDFIKMTITTLVIPLFRSKLRRRFHVYGNQFDKLYSLIPKDILPLEFGGNGESVHEISGRSMQDLIDHRTWFLTEGSSASDENKRRGKCPVNLPGCCIM
ncbi:alpha-tocopherol transfer protein-like [Rhodnius prolixus]|uniref:Putative phosphatidylinositol transfer protein sec14 panstrongylus megistus n=1 Tax=Rhodnius prolixus TaxID=13249 RepID=A0A4P6D948_RHOPR